MFKIFKDLMNAAAARQEEGLRDRFALDLIDQKIREADAQMKAAKATLASMIQRERAERRQLFQLEARIEDLTGRAQEALSNAREDLATEAASAIANMENERRIRQDTLRTIESSVLRLRQTIEATHRRILDLKQGAMAARAVRREQDLQGRLRTIPGQDAPVDEAEALIARVLRRDDPGEQAEILREINEGLNHETLTDRMASEGFGPSLKTTAADVLARLKATRSNPAT
ncbi:PspA/IM30 family protein [Jannaschia pohangensis]|uniref:Phage shock protein A (PspA) family protein n=1 Tax=Jannaschia pohangensis TaxID=390807 RepID=A0A1I3R8E6_9RHOB|nr:PspA/IM30 family protein [Jannaschia pohangensis]SFJ41929.1 phage shock protein A (PspA) family protein [Jannaschia pohangensis]